MPRSAGVNRANAIREYLTRFPDQMPKEAAAELQRQGVNVNSAYVSVVKSKMKGAGGNASDEGDARDASDMPPAASTADMLGTSLGAPGRGKVAKRKKRRKTRAPRQTAVSAPASAAASGSPSFGSLLKAKEMVDQLGGLGKARAALNALAELTTKSR